MPVSGSWDWIETQQSIIYAALRKIKAIPPGQDAPSDQMKSEASHALNSMVLSWQNEGIFLWSVSLESITLNAGVSEYTINNIKVIGIQDAFIREEDYDYPVRVITRSEYMNIPQKSLTGRPEKVYYHRRLADSNLIFWYVPDKTYTFYYTAINRLQDMDEMADNPDFPVEWSDALIYNLAYNLAPEYDLDVSEMDRLKVDAYEKKILAFLGSKEVGSMYICPKRR